MPKISRGLDHLMALTSDLDTSARHYEELGFTVTPRSFHPFGTANRLIMFRDNFLELLGIVDPSKLQKRHEKFSAFIARGGGGYGVALLSSDAEADWAEFNALGLQPQPPGRFRRSVRLPSGEQTEVVVDTVFLGKPEAPTFQLFVSRQHIPEALWVPQWQRHPNGALGISSVTLIAVKPRNHAEALARIFGVHRVRALPTGVEADTGNGLIRIVEPMLTPIHGDAPRCDEIRVSACEIETNDLAAAREFIAASSLPSDTADNGQASVLVDGIAIRFREVKRVSHAQ